jgi:prefoldin subunit 5
MSEWLDQKTQDRLLVLETSLARLEEQTSHIKRDMDESKDLIAQNAKTANEILTMFRWHKAVAKGVLLAVGFGLFILGRMEWTNIKAFSELLWSGR